MKIHKIVCVSESDFGIYLFVHLSQPSDIAKTTRCFHLGYREMPQYVRIAQIVFLFMNIEHVVRMEIIYFVQMYRSMVEAYGSYSNT